MSDSSHGWALSRREAVQRGIIASGIGLAGLSASAGSTAAAGHCDVVVDAGGGGDATTIQGGVDAAGPGDTVCVRSGTYPEQVVVGKDLALVGVGSPTIVAPNSPDQFAIPESSSTWEPVVFAHGGGESGGDVSGPGTVDVSVSGFTVDGADRSPGGRAVGVLARNVEGVIADNVVENMGVGGKETFGILAYGDSDLSIAGNDVSGYERGGIGANGDGGVNPAPTVHVDRNTVTGSTGIGVAWAPNGIQVGFGAEGRVTRNVVSDNRWGAGDDDWVASGIIVFESDGVQVRGNAVTNSDAAITCGSWSWLRPTADDTKVVRNEVQDAHVGVLLQAVAWDGVSSSDPSVSDAKVVNNVLRDSDRTDDDVGIALDAIDLDPDLDPILEDTKVIRNRITGFATPVDNEGTGTKIRANAP